MDNDTSLTKPKDADTTKLVVEDSGIELNPDADEAKRQTDPELLKSTSVFLNPAKAEEGLEIETINTSLLGLSIDACDEKSALYFSYLLSNFMVLKRKIEIASDILNLGRQRLVRKADIDMLSCLYEHKGDSLEGEMFEGVEKDGRFVDINGIIKQAIMHRPGEESTSKDLTIATNNSQENQQNLVISTILSQYRLLLKENQRLRQDLKWNRALHEDSRKGHEEFKESTEKTLAKLGEYVMVTRHLKDECEELKGIVERIDLEREFLHERLNESREFAKMLQIDVTEAEERADYFENEVIALKRKSGDCKDDSLMLVKKETEI